MLGVTTKREKKGAHEAGANGLNYRLVVRVHETAIRFNLL
jgi:hypothetical protein